MADKQYKITTSSKGQIATNNNAHILMPHNGLMVRKVTESEKISKAAKPMANELNTQKDQEQEPWQMIAMSKNKLKRKKKLSGSLASVGDAVNQEKRTRIEGIQLNCRGKLRARDTLHFEVTPSSAPKPQRAVIIGGVTTTTSVQAAAPQRLKRQLQENVETIQKLNTLTEQLRLEVNELKSSLITERGAVRALRAQNDADSRKWKTDVRKLQQMLDSAKKSSTKRPLPDDLINYEIQRLTNEIATLKEVGKTKEDKSQINGDAARRQAAEMRTLKNAYEIRLTQIQKSAKIEITRLLEEIKAKERNIGQLKKDLLNFQSNSKKQTDNHQHPHQVVSKIATIKIKTNETSQKSKKPTKSTIKTQSSQSTQTTQTTKTTSETTTIPTIIPTTTIGDPINYPTNPIHQAQVTHEITQLKNIELINNTRNVHKSLEMRQITNTQNGLRPNSLTLRDEMMTRRHEEIIGGKEDGNGTVTTWHSLPQDVVCALLTKATSQTKSSHDTQEYRPKDTNSDTDSALSSAPPSISPQPPSTGSDSGVMWQTMHSYNKDLEKLQKEVEFYHKENERLQTELQLMKQELVTAEKAALAAANTTQMSELLERVNTLEARELQLTAEADELLEQNELLEFRILELEDDKMEDSCEAHCQRLQSLLERSQLEESDKSCLRQLLSSVQVQMQLENGNLELLRSEQQRSTTTSSSPGSRQALNRIVATVQPYNNNSPTSGGATPQESPRKQRANNGWQCSSLSESGVFVECDFGVDPLVAGTSSTSVTNSVDCTAVEAKRLQYYKERLELLERKVLVYESSGEVQAKHLADRLQREVLLEAQLKELIGRVECLLQQNSLLEEEKCEFEEAENDTRLGLQRLEVELEILRQRNVELEFSKDALGAKYKDCRAECLILREDLCTYETQVLNLEHDRELGKQELARVRRSVPLILFFRLLALARQAIINMGNEVSAASTPALESASPRTSRQDRTSAGQCPQNSQRGTNIVDMSNDSSACREISYLKEEVKGLRAQINDLNSRHYEAMETADSHWLELEREYKEREEAHRSKEACLKQKILKLQDCLRDDSRAAAEKIQQLEEAEQGLKTCLVRLTKEHKCLLDEYHCMQNQMESSQAQKELEEEEQRPVSEELENEKRRSQALIDDLAYCKKLQQSTEEQLKTETDAMRKQIYDLKKEFMQIEVTNSELREEVRTLEAKICEMQQEMKCAEDYKRCLEDELRSKDDELRCKEEMCQTLERKLGICPEGFSLADELYDSPAKRARRDEVRDLKTASQGLACALRDIERRERELPTHREFQAIACSVKQLADQILSNQNQSEEEGAEVSACGGSEDKPKTVCRECNCDEDKPKGGECDVEGETDKEAEGEADASAKATESQPRPSGSIRNSVGSRRGSDRSDRDDRSRRSSGGGIGHIDIRSLTVGMALMPSLPSQFQFKKPICEVPSQLRKLNYKDSDHAVRQSGPAVAEDLRRKRRFFKRFIYRRFVRCRMRPWGGVTSNGRLVDSRSPSFTSYHSLVSIHSVHSEVGDPLPSPCYAEIIAPQRETLKMHVAVQTSVPTTNQTVQAVPVMYDQQVLVKPEQYHCRLQTDEMDVAKRMLLLPVRTRAFVQLVERSVELPASFDNNDFNARLLLLWETSEDFREHIEILQNLCSNKGPDQQQESYENFVGVLSCVRALKYALKPHTSALLRQVEELINDRLIKFHTRQVEKDFNLTVYYPVERLSSENLNQ